MNEHERTGEMVHDSSDPVDAGPDDSHGDYAISLPHAGGFLISRPDGRHEYASFPVETRRAQLTLANMRGKIGNDIAELKRPEGVLVTDVFVTHQDYISKDGERIQGPVVHLCSPDGRSYRISAKYLVVQILEFIKHWQPFPWTVPVRMKASDYILPNNHRTYKLEVGE